MKRPTLACAHRGLSAEEPENTLAAFRAAVDAGAHALELDVRLSNDGHPVVMHDANIARTTDGVGRVGDLDLKEIQTYETADGPVPALADVLDAMADWDGVWDIEVKVADAVPAVLDQVESHGLSDHTIITSMDPDALMTVHKELPAMAHGLIALGPPDAEDWDAVDATGCDWIMVHEEFIDTPMVQKAKEAGCNMGAWTVNDVDRAKELVGMGVHMIITDQRDVLEACCH